MEWIETSDGGEYGCTFCHTHEGPFLRLVGGELMGVPTADGMVAVPHGIRVCVGRFVGAEAENGCARTLGVLAGCLSPRETVGLQTQTRAALDANEELHGRLQAAEQKIVELEARPVQRVVSVEDLKHELTQ